MPYVFNPFSGTFDWTAAGVPTLTTGGVTFGGSTGLLTQDTTNLNYISSTRQFGVASTTVERITNGTFTGSASGWALTTGWTYSNNTVVHNLNGTNPGTGNLSQTPTLSWGERWDVSFTLSDFTAGNVSISFAGNNLGTVSAAGTYTYRVMTKSTSQGIVFTPSNTARFTLDNVSAKVLNGGQVAAGEMIISGSGALGTLTIAGGKSDSFPTVSRHMSLENSGSYTWIDFKFQNIDRAHIGADSTGQVSTYVGGGNYDAVYNKANNQLISYNTPGAFGHYGYGGFQQGVNAGGVSNPSSTLMSQGGTALKVKYITTNQTLDNTATEWIADASSPTCTGTPSNACSSYTNEGDCLARDAHGGCSWFAGYSCSTYNGDESGCTGQSPCVWEQASCAGFGDQTTCESYTGCSWTNNPQDCSTLDQTTCGNTSGCTQNFDDCANYSDGGGDGTACNNANGGGYCTYDSGTGACTGGTWYISCSGSYDSYSCTGTYATGNCTGTYGAECSGTASCGGIDDQTNCNAESGCTWQTAITLTLPSITTCPDRDYWIYNNSSTNADVVVVSAAGDTIDYTTSYTLSNLRDWIHISPLRRTASCGGLSEGTCGSTSGCYQYYFNCQWDSFLSSCVGDASCFGYGDQSACQAAQYYAGCSGEYVVSSNWYVFGR